MSKEKVWNERWIIWWIYGNGNQLVQCKCVQDKMKFRTGENIRGETWEIQLVNFSNVFQSSNQQNLSYKSHLYKVKSHKFELLEASIYYYCSISSIRNFILEIEESTVLCIFYPSLEEYQPVSTIFKVFIRVFEIFEEGIIYKKFTI